ncbi:autophagy-related protein 13 homolog [Aricia agestis]|uniref:autophagy-related protein 13 homolog n=1 Tax=Aricia agestis TaxID=91739 RepID=UPI001C207278|nr:autophagy-related protein 13 homolog [Aricia agestis]
MASTNIEAHDRFKLYKFTKILTLKVAQIVVQSRQGKKISHDNVIKVVDDFVAQNNLQWFNLSIPDVPEVNTDTKKILNGEVIEALTNVLCIEISLHTNDGDEMVLEMWTVRIVPNCDVSVGSVSTIYYRMSIMLKSTLSISRITPAYKMSRLQNKDSYKISYKIYGGQPNLDLLGEKYKTIKVSELHTPIGTIQIEVVYRTKMTILPEDRRAVNNKIGEDIMVKSDHFPRESPRKNHEKKAVDLTKPLTAGAFVDHAKIKELHETLSQQLPPEPPMNWLLAEKDKMEKRMRELALSESLEKPCSSNQASTSEVVTASKAIEVPKMRDNKYASLMEFPFADGSPITELASFYQECVAARCASDAWDNTASTDSTALARQLQAFEDAVPEFDNLLADMCASDHSSDT